MLGRTFGGGFCTRVLAGGIVVCGWPAVVAVDTAAGADDAAAGADDFRGLV